MSLKGECQQVLEAMSGNFTSPSYPNIYPNNMNCHWSVVLPPGFRIKLFFPVMELEDQNSLTDSCDFDSVAVHDGESQTDVLLGCWCGTKQPPPLTSKANKLLVVLNTDRNIAFKGFSASYTGGERTLGGIVMNLHFNFLVSFRSKHREGFQWKVIINFNLTHYLCYKAQFSTYT